MFATVAAFLILTLVVLGITLPFALKGETRSMKDTQGLVFELYRYGVCFVMVLAFTGFSYAVLGGLLVDPGNVRALGGPALGILLSVCLFFIHWRMKNPAQAAD